MKFYRADPEIGKVIVFDRERSPWRRADKPLFETWKDAHIYLLAANITDQELNERIILSCKLKIEKLKLEYEKIKEMKDESEG